MEIQLWRSILCPYELAVRELTVKFEHIIEEHRQNDLYSPIEQVRGDVYKRQVYDFQGSFHTQLTFVNLDF